MALVLHNISHGPLGQFDSLDANVSSYLGGEAVVFSSVSTTGSDEAAADVKNDGYDAPKNTRPAVTFAGGSAGNGPPVFLSDDGIAHYGTLFGAVVGGTVGQQANGPNSYTGAVLGPSTALGSGKVTLWDKPGLYGVTLDAVDQTFMVPTNTQLSINTVISWNTSGKLTPLNGLNNGITMVSNSAPSAGSLGYLVEFATTGSSVTTQQTMVAALNSPSGDVTSVQALSFYQMVLWFVGASA